MTGIRIRQLRSTDVPFALEQTLREGWDSTAESFAALLGADPDGSLIAEATGRPVGLVTTIRYRLTGWIGNLIVEPAHRSRGVGRRLMAAGLDRLAREGIETVRLEADPAGVPLYRSLGFVDEFESLRFRRSPSASGPGQSTPIQVRRLEMRDLPGVARVDAVRFGDDRMRFLEHLTADARAAVVALDDGAVGGHMLVVPSRAGARIGPWVASDARVAGAMLDTVLGRFPESPLIVGLPEPNHAGVTLLGAAGFVATPSSRRMVRGPVTGAGDPTRVFAIATGAVG